MRMGDFGLVSSVPQRSWQALTQIDSVAFVHVDLDGRIQYANAGVSRIFGYMAGELIGHSIEVLLPKALRERHAGYLSDYISRRAAGRVRASPIVRQTRHFPRELRSPDGDFLRFAAVASDGREIPISLTVNEVHSASGELAGFVGMIVDCSDEHALQERIRHQALHDEATGLLNWRGLHEAVVRLDRNNRQACRGDGHTLLNIDIDHFSALAFECKAVADHAIVLAAHWLRDRVEEWSPAGRGMVARHFTATEFLVHLADTSHENASEFAETLREAFCSLNLGTDINPFYTTLSIGVARADAGMTLDYLLARAANAGYLARARGHDRVVVAAEDDTQIYALGHEIRHALRAGRIDVHAQRLVPLSRLHDGDESPKLYFEVLCRLRDRRDELIEPGRVFPAAEKLGLAVALDLHMIGRVLGALARHCARPAALEQCSINLSGITLSSDSVFAEIQRLIRVHGADPQKLCFEITESSRIRDRQVALRNVQQLRGMGCRIALDDFGSGYSNYQSLIQWPIDIVKIDGSYIRRILEAGALKTDVEGMIASAKARGIEIVAEYVESESVSRALKRMGVDFAQGFRFHRAEPIERLLRRLDGRDNESA
ncbi:EAL domain-containing protein [Wenzhouxiangella sp. EGI_FJ10305]|uniref:EAL domain-containing protein n=1 Tax=Wenzhouxiangella sp. EGI_FJ10305 TaxID=3243768 RepID=UPI0035D57DF6